MSEVQTLYIVNRPVNGDERDFDGRVRYLDIYALQDTDLNAYRGLIVSMSADQIHLEKCRPQLDAWVQAGGRVLTNGHILRRYITGLPSWRKMMFHGVEDVWLTRVADHPVLAGVDMRDVLLRTGVPGAHSFAKMLEIGVAGFYGRSYLVDLPADARVVTGIGQYNLPLDIAYDLGKGQVFVHAGNDLLSFAFPGKSSEHLAGQIIDWLEAR